MPMLDGPEAGRRIRAAYPKMQLVYVTMHEDGEQVYCSVRPWREHLRRQTGVPANNLERAEAIELEWRRVPHGLGGVSRAPSARGARVASEVPRVSSTSRRAPTHQTRIPALGRHGSMKLPSTVTIGVQVASHEKNRLRACSAIPDLEGIVNILTSASAPYGQRAAVRHCEATASIRAMLGIRRAHALSPVSTHDRSGGCLHATFGPGA